MIADTRSKVHSGSGSNIYSLRPHLQEIHDYVAVQASAWAYFKKWYGCDFEVVTN